MRLKQRPALGLQPFAPLPLSRSNKTASSQKNTDKNWSYANVSIVTDRIRCNEIKKTTQWPKEKRNKDNIAPSALHMQMNGSRYHFSPALAAFIISYLQTYS